jgi:hypothetical protein
MSTTEHVIPLEHQGEVFQNSKQLTNGMKVLDIFLGRNRIVTVVKRYKISVRLSYVDAQGRVCEYVESLRNLRRLETV